MAHQHQVQVGDYDGELALIAIGGEGPWPGDLHPPVGAIGQVFQPLLARGRRAGIVDPTLGQQAFAVPDPVAQVEQAEPGEIPRRAETVGRADKGPGRVELGRGAGHAEGPEQPLAHEGLEIRAVFVDRPRQATADDVGRAAGIGPEAPRLMRQRLVGRMVGDILLTLAEQHGDHVRGVVRRIILDKGQTAGHAQQQIQRQLAARIAGGAPLGHVGRGVDVQLAVQNQHPRQGLGHALGHGPGRIARLRAIAVGVALQDQLAALDDDQGVGLAQGLRRGFQKRIRQQLGQWRLGHGRRQLAGRPGLGGPGDASGLGGQGRQRHVDHPYLGLKRRNQ